MRRLWPAAVDGPFGAEACAILHRAVLRTIRVTSPSAADADAGAVVAARSDDRRSPRRDDRAVRAGAAGPVDAPRADDGVRLNRERCDEENGRKRRV